MLPILYWNSAALFLALLALAGVSLELGHWLGLRLRPRYDERVVDQLGSIQAGVLGTLGILLGFVLSIVLLQFIERRDLVVREADAIGTAYIRAQFLEEPEREEVRAILRRYIHLRLEIFESRGTGEAQNARFEAAVEACRDLQGRLWDATLRATQKDSRPILNLFVDTVNEVIDLDTHRYAAWRHHVPRLVLDVLIVFAIVSLGMMSFVSATRCAQRVGAWYLLGGLLCMLLLVIVDLDRPRLGWIPVDHDAMEYEARGME